MKTRPCHSTTKKRAIRIPGSILKAQLGLALSLSLFICGYTIAQEKEVLRENQVWLQYYGQAKLSQKWTWQFDGGFRWREVLMESTQHILRTAIGYSPRDHVRLSVGLAHLGFYSDEKLPRVEFRPYQEVQLTQPLAKVSLNHRFRLEQRIFYPVVEGRIQQTNHFHFRVRYATLLGIPLFKLSRDNPQSAFILYVGDEIFLNFGPEITNNYFDQNRLLISPTFRLNEALSISLTWNNQFASTPVPSAYEHTQVFWLQIRHHLDWSKGKTGE